MAGLIGVTVTVPEGVLPVGVQGDKSVYPRTPFSAPIEHVYHDTTEIAVQLYGWYYDVSKVEFHSPAYAAG